MRGRNMRKRDINKDFFEKLRSNANKRANIFAKFRRDRSETAEGETGQGDVFGPDTSHQIGSQLHPFSKISKEHLGHIIDQVKDWQTTHGSLLKLVRTEEAHTILARPIGAAVFPSSFPKSCFEEARSLQTAYNELYAGVANDDAWLQDALAPLLTGNTLAWKLWNIHQQLTLEGHAQPLTMGIFRSDYMLQSAPSSSPDPTPQLKQVEFNTVSCAGIAHSSHISSLHRHLHRTGSYDFPGSPARISSLPASNNIISVATFLAHGRTLYGPPASPLAAPQTCVLMLVQPFNINIADERPFEYALWDLDVPCYRVLWGREFLARTELGEARELLYRPPHRPGARPMEVAVVYLRAGYDEDEYDAAGVECRSVIERSRAISCPDVRTHLATLKIVQERLGREGEVERFLHDKDMVARVRATFVSMARLDESDRGLLARQAALDEEKAAGYVLKPSLEGGGHNIYGQDIPHFLKTLKENLWGNYVLMEMIRPPDIYNILISPSGLHEGAVESELGIVGGCIWKMTERYPQVLRNDDIGFTLKTKAKGVNEMSVIKGYGCFDSPNLIGTQIVDAQET